jgi:putative transposase
MRVAEPFAREIVPQVSRRVCPEVPKTGDFWNVEDVDRQNLEATVRAGGVEIVEGHAMPDHVHLCLSIPPKFSVANTVGFLKGKPVIRIHREHFGRERGFTGFHFWAQGYCVSTVGLDEQTVREYICNQEAEEKRQEQLYLGGLLPPSSNKQRL